MASGSATGDNLTTKELYTLGRFKHLGLMQYRDTEAYYCTDCNTVYNVKCANCQAWTPNKHHLGSINREDPVIYVETPIVVRRDSGLYWTMAICRKCDFRFLVIVR